MNPHINSWPSCLQTNCKSGYFRPTCSCNYPGWRNHHPSKNINLFNLICQAASADLLHGSSSAAHHPALDCSSITPCLKLLMLKSPHIHGSSIISHAFQPLCFSTLMLIYPHAFQPSCFSTLMLYNPHALQPSCFSALMLFCIFCHGSSCSCCKNSAAHPATTSKKRGSHGSYQNHSILICFC